MKPHVTEGECALIVVIGGQPLKWHLMNILTLRAVKAALDVFGVADTIQDAAVVKEIHVWKTVMKDGETNE